MAAVFGRYQKKSGIEINSSCPARVLSLPELTKNSVTEDVTELQAK
jgi:hypothetical protein